MIRIDDWVFAGKQDFGPAMGAGFALDRGSDGDGGIGRIGPVVWGACPGALVRLETANAKRAGSLGDMVMFLVQPGVSHRGTGHSLGADDVSLSASTSPRPICSATPTSPSIFRKSRSMAS